MKVLITGASAKLGAYVIRSLADNHELVLVSHNAGIFLEDFRLQMATSPCSTGIN